MTKEKLNYKKYLKEKELNLEHEIFQLLKEFHSLNINANEYISLAETKFLEGESSNISERLDFLERLKKALNTEITKFKVNTIVTGVQNKFSSKEISDELIEASKKVLSLCVHKMNMIDEEGLDICDEIVLFSYKIMKLCLSRKLEVTAFFNLVTSNERMKKHLNSLVLKDVNILSNGIINLRYLFDLKSIVFELENVDDEVYPYASIGVINSIVNVSYDKGVREIIINTLLIESIKLTSYNINIDDLILEIINKYYDIENNLKTQRVASRKYKKSLRKRYVKLREQLDELRERLNSWYQEFSKTSSNEIEQLFNLIEILNYSNFSDFEEYLIKHATEEVVATKKLEHSIKKTF